MVANHTSADSTNVLRLPNRRVEDPDNYAAAVRAFLAAAHGDAERQPGALRRRSEDRSRGQRPALELPCQRHDPSLWFAEAPSELERAKALCALCPVRLACLAVAVDHAAFAGVWGGHLFHRGQIVAHKRPRGRPRKHQPQRAASPHGAAPGPEENVMTPNAPAALYHGSAAVRSAAARLYDAECALHSAHQSHVDSWVDAAMRRLHAAVTDYLAVATSSGLERRNA
jgi:WhiB family redox-sensing transcriptional regulator